MPSSDLTTQLGLWREIVASLHENSDPGIHHLDFIRKCFNELDLEGFIWSKESIFSIFTQLGLSKISHERFSPVNDPQGHEISSVKVKDIIQSEKLEHKSRPVGLADLPIEVFYKILEQLDCIAIDEVWKIYKEKFDRRVMISGPAHGNYMTYLHRNSPIFNSIQSFSLTSRQIYSLCRPWLWRKLEFPTSLPAPIDLWTEDILVRQGAHVQTLQVMLSKNCSSRPGEFAKEHPFYDNLSPDCARDEVECISPDNLREVLHMCPNLSKLIIKCYYEEELRDRGGTEAFLIDLIPLLSRLRRLRHLSLEGGNEIKIMNGFPSKVVASLPLLESFDCYELTESKNQQKPGHGSFGFNLSQLKYLSKLTLWKIEDIDGNWCLYNWPRTIKKLMILECGDLSLSLAHQIIHHIAPNLTKLGLEFAYKLDDDNWEIDPSWDAGTKFSLPFLTELRLSTRNAHLLESFQDCKSLRRLKWTYRTSTHCRSLNMMIFKNTWPQLKNLDTTHHWRLRLPALDPQLQEMEDQLTVLEKHCKQANIGGFIGRPDSYDH